VVLPDPPDPPLLDIATIMTRIDPFIGTGGFAFNYAAQTPAAQVPLGMVRLGPDTTNAGAHAPFHHFSGYHFDDPDVRGFSHTHFVGTGIVDYGNIRVLPWRDLDLDAVPQTLFTPLDKDSEVARPGYYTVDLPEQDVTVELSATRRAGIHRYTFGEGGRVRLLIDAAAHVANGEVQEAVVQYSGASIEGWVTYRGPLTGRTRPFTLYFSARLSQTPAAEAVWDDEGVQENVQSAVGDSAGAIVSVDVEAGEAVELRVGLSYIDLEQARQNRLEVTELSLEEVAQAAWDEWAALLDKVRIGGGTEEQQRVFYTALYHSYTMPTQLDEGGRYRGLDGEVHGTDTPYFTDLSLWDTFRSLHPWYILMNPDIQRNVLHSLLQMAADAGYVPRWPAGLSYGGSMIGTSADMLFAGSALKGIDGIDYDAALDALLVTANAPTPPGSPFGGRRGVASYLENGYMVTDGGDDGTVSRTLEYVYSDWALANLAEHLGRPEAAELRERGGYYRNLFDPEQNFFAARNADGTFLEVRPHVLYQFDGPFVEGTAWHWRFSVFHDPEGLVELYGGPDAFAEIMTTYFERSKLGLDMLDHRVPDVYFWHGNQPGLHVAYLWTAAGRPDTGADWLRAIQTRIYLDTPEGLPGNDDGGTLSSWYLFSALGLYPVAGSTTYRVGTPLFPIAELQTAGGPLTIRAPGASDTRRYVRRIEADGEPREGWTIDHADLLGGTLYFNMQE
jgi:predicted alpha-1,2-mannosidase